MATNKLSAVWTPNAVPSDAASLPVYLARELLRASQVIKIMQERIDALEAKATSTTATTSTT